MLTRQKEPSSPELWIPSDSIVAPPQLPFYSKLSELLDGISFGDRVRELCSPYYSSTSNGRPPVDPEVYFKMLMVGFYENIGSERGIALRCADSLGIRSFLRYGLTDRTPEHSTLSVIRGRLPDAVFNSVFTLILSALRDAGLVKGKHLGADTSVIEANAALRSLRHRLTEKSYRSYVLELATAAGVDTSDMAAVARFDRKRANRKTSNSEWHNPHDPDSKISRDKHGATDMLYKTEHVVDLDTGAIVDVSVLPADQGDAEKLTDRIDKAQARLEEIGAEPAETLTADKGYFAAETVAALAASGLEPVIPDRELNRNEHSYKPEVWMAVKAAHESAKSDEGKELLRKRGQHIERSFAHVLDSGGSRRTTLRGIPKISKRQTAACAAYNLSLLMRVTTKFGTPKQWAAKAKSAFCRLRILLYLCERWFKRLPGGLELFGYPKPNQTA
jgi:transposase